MENFDRENIDELLEIRQIRQYFPRQKFKRLTWLQSSWPWNRIHCSKTVTSVDFQYR